MTPTPNFYFFLRGLAFCVAALLGLLLLSAFVWVPFYAGEGNTPQFQDRIFQLIGQFLFFVIIITPYRWTVTAPFYQSRLAFVVLTVVWVCAVDIIAYYRGLTYQLLSLGSLIAVAVGVLVFATLIMHRHRCKPARS